MAFTTLSLLALSLKLVAAQNPATTALEPLASKHFTYPNLPYQVTGDQGGIRGPQSGYNICNSTTQGPNSKCQTLFLNSLDDFCMWSTDNAPGDLDTIGASEAREVAWCTKPIHGGRQIPAGAITGAQWLYAKNYVQVVGFIDQTQIGLQASDEGGELDPHGADEQGNPLGGVVFTNAFGLSASQYASNLKSNATPSQTFTQVIEWIDFIGGGIFCLKMCNPSDPQAPELCQHIYDRIGCGYNALADYNDINGTYTVCDSDDMSPPGVYTTNGAATTWFQPPEGVVPTPPYTPTLPASSNCQTFSSAQLFGSPTSAPAATLSGGASPSGSGSGSAGSVGSGSNPSGSKNGGASGGSVSSTSKPSNNAAAGGNITARQVLVTIAPVVLVGATTVLTMILSLAAL